MVTIYSYVREEGVPAAPADVAQKGESRPLSFRKNVAVAELPALLAREDTFLWVDLQAPDEDETDLLASVFHFHPLAIEDCIFDRAYPKVDEYPDYLYLVLHGMRPPGETPASGGPLKLGTRELDMFLGARFLVTFHHEEMRSILQARALVEKNPEHLGRGPAFLLHHVLDYLVDHYLPVMDDLDGRIDAMEAAVAGPNAETVITQVFQVRTHVNEIRRLALRQREVLARMARREFSLIDAAAALYFRDIYDHLARVADQAESYREVLSSLVEIALARISNRLNTIMKALTLVNTIFLPLTFLTGVYGMNFDNLPGKSHPYGFWVLAGVMVVGAAVMLTAYRKKKWL